MSNKTRFPLIALFLALSVWMSAEMYYRTQAELLWCYRPLVLFLAVWGLFVLALGGRFSRLAHKDRLLLASTVSGFLLALGFPDPVPMPLFMFIAFVPLLWVEDQIAQSREKGTTWEVFKFSYHTFILWNILSTYWVANTSLPAGIFAITVNAGLMSIPFVLFHQARKEMPKLAYLAFIVFWITFEYMHLNWDLTWPWLTLGNSFAEYPSWVQWYEYTGVFGGTLWILLVNVLIFQILKKNDWKFKWRSLLRPLILIAAPIAASLWIYFQYEETGDTIEVVAVQPNYEPHYEKFEVPEGVQMDRFVELTMDQIDEETDYIVFPETSFGYIETDKIAEYSAVRRMQEVLSQFPQTKLIAGIDAVHYFKPGEPHSRAVRQGVDRNGQPFYYEIINGAIQIDPANPTDIPLYKKSKLVPGPEIFPFKKVFFFFEPLVRSLGGTTAGVGTQPERSVLSSETARVAPVICYESVFGEYHTGYIRKGAQVIFIMTNDGWWDHTAGHRQHLYFASLRAIETRRSIARSANTGISAFINQRGDISQPTRYGETTAIKGKLHLNDAITFYVRWGDIIARISLFTAALLLLNILVSWAKGFSSGRN